MNRYIFLLCVAAAIVLTSFECSNHARKRRANQPAIQEIYAPAYYDSVAGKVEKLYDEMGEIKPGDWLYSHNEKHIPFNAYRNSSPVRADSVRKVIYLQPFNDLDSLGDYAVNVVAEYLRAFYSLEVRIMDKADVSKISSEGKRMHYGNEQFLTGFLLDTFLIPALPADGAVIIGLTAHDLYPKDSWNFVFGQAYLTHRAGVWSIARLCEDMTPETMWNYCVPRTLKTASHETGHMFSITHCIKYKCAFNGSNSLEESDERPLWICPECLKKLCWNLQIDPLDHFRNLAAFWRKNGKEEFAKFYDANLLACDNKKAGH